ncbi:MAG: DNA alkylation repair protein [Candidatus Doudnabacteria bacterium RIFCSPLOWO2_02_FULL_42_9]|uniref:DNA alkylation repair protein n=1 Tax=Candidatus Doudnabacteria bacterium RIFCSPHIGHO2_01_FULL_41_86 TaxID=1817821 RepID=A0A1F5N9A9_9BACT|nr:MAG: DNA alkylation repair protein [Candidatus Doudnabacteria bacterium RIFCSPHIGHO2_01_FULL_41_86]OGE75205.1 MAG: DNA alkylation repair protein [Candidatus Doudnabacteria bacterium RIFCSPHIGHO2_01_43_10]OGE85180.1 MAG: DNA alkylation repair protein [Candidatus Doudnabacteria bacterium RIFCSPHIGHO2_12_FULL_42_22]OGE86718.1 MAG: DNA alkylation repair protein [Candidatus Doudnabacteria bacterium RIFCSPHIGHO2_02_FULL_42_25]OGE92316.1 MAG: DNA alkylation repair protein [Candidatus Doudnabacteria
MNKLKKLKNELNKAGSPRRAKASMWFFKTEKGSYGHGDVFLGIRVPVQRVIAKKYLDLSLKDLQVLLNSKIHEHRLVALIILVTQFNKAGENARKRIFDFYIKNTTRVNNWDLVDTSAGYIVGGYLLQRPKGLLTKLAKSKLLWDRRIAMIATHRFIYEKQFDEAFKIAKILLNDQHDLIHKAVGWMLREVGNRDQRAEEKFLRKYYKKMPRTALRYAIEKFPKGLQKNYLSGKI